MNLKSLKMYFNCFVSETLLFLSLSVLSIDCTAVQTEYIAEESKYSPAIVAPNVPIVQKYSSPSPSLNSVQLPYVNDQQLLSYSSLPQSSSYADNTFSSTEAEPVSFK